MQLNRYQILSETSGGKLTPEEVQNLEELKEIDFVNQVIKSWDINER